MKKPKKLSEDLLLRIIECLGHMATTNRKQWRGDINPEPCDLLNEVLQEYVGRYV